MRRTLLSATMVVLTALLASCNSAPPPPVAPVSAPKVSQAPGITPAPPPVTATETTQAQLTLPAQPLWPEPGLSLWNATHDQNSAYTYEPFTLDGESVQTVMAAWAVSYFRQTGNEIYLVGSDTDRGGFKPLAEPRLLYRVPLKVGDQWTLNGETHSVEAVELLDTPAGQKVAARVDVRGQFETRTDWWVPGYGLVRMAWPDRQPWTAAAEEREKPRQAPVIGRPQPDMQAILRDTGNEWLVTSLTDGKELFRIEDGYWRSWYGWQSVGGQDLLTHAHFPGSWGIFGYAAHLYDPGAGQFRRVLWVQGGTEAPGVSGDGAWGDDGSFALRVHQRYPVRSYTYRFDGKAMVSDSALERMEYAKTREDLLRRLVGNPPLSLEDTQAMFHDARLGQAAYDLLMEGRDTVVVQAVNGTENQFDLTDGGRTLLARAIVDQVEGQWKITDFVIK